MHELVQNQHINLREGFLVAIQHYQSYLQRYFSCSSKGFQGLGNIQQLDSFKQVVLEWFSQDSKKDASPGSFYDLLILCYIISGNQEQGKKWYEKMIDKNPKAYWLYFSLANLQYNSKNYRKAEQYYFKVLELNEDFPKTYLQLAWIRLREKNKSQAKKWIQKYLQIKVGDLQSEIILALCQEDHKNQFQRLRKLAQIYPECNNIKAQLSGQSQLVSLVVKQCFESLEDKDSFAIPLLRMSKQYKDKKNYATALECARRAIECDPSSEKGFDYLQKAVTEQNNYSQEIKNYFQKLTRVNQTNVMGFYGDAKCNLKRGRQDQGIILLTRCLFLDPNFHLANYELSLIFSKKNNLIKAIENSQKTVGLYPNMFRYQMNLAKIFQKSLKKNKAFQCYENALKIQPGNTDLMMQIGKNYMIENSQRAIKFFKLALEVNPNILGAYIYLGGCYFTKLRFDQAYKAYMDCLLLNPKDPFCNFRLFQTCKKLGKIRQTLQFYERTIIYSTKQYESKSPEEFLMIKKSIQEFGDGPAGQKIRGWRPQLLKFKKVLKEIQFFDIFSTQFIEGDKFMPKFHENK